MSVSSNELDNIPPAINEEDPISPSPSSRGATRRSCIDERADRAQSVALKVAALESTAASRSNSSELDTATKKLALRQKGESPQTKQPQLDHSNAGGASITQIFGSVDEVVREDIEIDSPHTAISHTTGKITPSNIDHPTVRVSLPTQNSLQTQQQPQQAKPTEASLMSSMVERERSLVPEAHLDSEVVDGIGNGHRIHSNNDNVAASAGDIHGDDDGDDGDGDRGHDRGGGRSFHAQKLSCSSADTNISVGTSNSTDWRRSGQLAPRTAEFFAPIGTFLQSSSSSSSGNENVQPSDARNHSNGGKVMSDAKGDSMSKGCQYDRHGNGSASNASRSKNSSSKTSSSGVNSRSSGMHASSSGPPMLKSSSSPRTRAAGDGDSGNGRDTVGSPRGGSARTHPRPTTTVTSISTPARSDSRTSNGSSARGSSSIRGRNGIISGSNPASSNGSTAGRPSRSRSNSPRGRRYASSSPSTSRRSTPSSSRATTPTSTSTSRLRNCSNGISASIDSSLSRLYSTPSSRNLLSHAHGLGSGGGAGGAAAAKGSSGGLQRGGTGKPCTIAVATGAYGASLDMDGSDGENGSPEQAGSDTSHTHHLHALDPDEIIAPLLAKSPYSKVTPARPLEHERRSNFLAPFNFMMMRESGTVLLTDGMTIVDYKTLLRQLVLLRLKLAKRFREARIEEDAELLTAWRIVHDAEAHAFDLFTREKMATDIVQIHASLKNMDGVISRVNESIAPVFETLSSYIRLKVAQQELADEFKSVHAYKTKTTIQHEFFQKVSALASSLGHLKRTVERAERSNKTPIRSQVSKINSSSASNQNTPSATPRSSFITTPTGAVGDSTAVAAATVGNILSSVQKMYSQQQQNQQTLHSANAGEVSNVGHGDAVVGGGSEAGGRRTGTGTEGAAEAAGVAGAAGTEEVAEQVVLPSGPAGHPGTMGKRPSTYYTSMLDRIASESSDIGAEDGEEDVQVVYHR